MAEKEYLGDFDRHVIQGVDGLPHIVRRGHRICPRCGSRWNSSSIEARGPKPMCINAGCEGVELGPLVPLGSKEWGA